MIHHRSETAGVVRLSRAAPRILDPMPIRDLTLRIDQILPAAKQALNEERAEIARRLAGHGLEQGVEPASELRQVLHDALAFLGDLPGAMAALDEHDRSFATAIRQCEDWLRMGAPAFYRLSPEAARGLTYDEYALIAAGRRAAAAEAVLSTIRTTTEAAQARRMFQRAVADLERRSPADLNALAQLDRNWPPALPAAAPLAIAVRVDGRITFPNDRIPRGTVTLGIETGSGFAHPLAVKPQVIGVDLGPAASLMTVAARLEADGTFSISGHAQPGVGFLAFTWDDPVGIPTKYLARDLVIDGTPLAKIELLINASAKLTPDVAEASDTTLPLTIEHDGRIWQRQQTATLRNPFWYDFPRQDIHLNWPAAQTGVDEIVWDGTRFCPAIAIAPPRSCASRT